MTIGGSDVCPTSIGQLNLTWPDDDRFPYTTILEDMLYIPDFPVYVFSVTSFAAHLDDDGVWLKTSHHQSVFAWYYQKKSLNL